MTQLKRGVVWQLGVLTLLGGLAVGCGQGSSRVGDLTETSSLSAQSDKDSAPVTVDSSKELLITDLSVIEDVDASMIEVPGEGR